MRVVRLFREAETDVALQTFGGLVVERDEDLIGRRIESQRVATFHQHLADTVRGIVGVAGDAQVQAVGEQRVETAVPAAIPWPAARHAA